MLQYMPKINDTERKQQEARAAMMKNETDSTETHVVNRRDTSGELMAENAKSVQIWRLRFPTGDRGGNQQ